MALTGVLLTPGYTPNSLGVIRAFGRRGIPVVYVDSGTRTMVRYSRYITKRLRCKITTKADTELVDVLLKFGEKSNDQMMIIPTTDTDALLIAKHKHELEQSYYVPVPALETIQQLVNKKNFYRLLTKTRIPHPKTYFPGSLTELRSTGREVAYPYIIKPAYSQPFQELFGCKMFGVTSPQQLDKAVHRLRGKNVDVMIQEIIPGSEIYMFYTYLDRNSQPLALCGYDKIRQYPVDFGSGSFCRSHWRDSAVEECVQLLRTIGYHGFAEPELKRDPRDGEFKLLEINARTTLQNRLPAACGADIEHIAYLDAAGRWMKRPFSFRADVLWVDDLVDILSCLILIGRRELGIREMIRSTTARKVHSVAAWDDPAPLVVHAFNLGSAFLVRMSRRFMKLANATARTDTDGSIGEVGH